MAQSSHDSLDPAERWWAQTDEELHPTRDWKRSLGPRPAEARPGCAGRLSSVLVVGGIVVGLGLFVAWQYLKTPYYGSVGPGPGFFGFFIALACVPIALVLAVSWLAFFRPGIRELGKVGSVCLCYVVGMGLLIWAPWIPPRTYVTPEIVGIVASSDYDPLGIDRVRLEDGRTFELRVSAQQSGQLSALGRYAPLADGPYGIGVGDLLLAGEHPTPWYTPAFAAYSASTDASNRCYGIEAIGVSRPDTVDLDTGLRLDKAARFNVDNPPTEYGFSSVVCLNREGDVTTIIGGI